MQIAVRWAGGFGWVLVAATATAALVVIAAPRHEPESTQRTELTYRGYVTGLVNEAPPEVALRARHADDEALAACMDAWPGKLVIRSALGRPGTRVVQVEENTLLDQCLQVRHWQDARFSRGVWSGPPADATLNVPSQLGSARVRSFDPILDEREREAAALADGSIVAASCPATPHTSFDGLPSLEFRMALSTCVSRYHSTVDHRHRFRLALDGAGNVIRVIAPPEHLPEVPCLVATACGRRFAGLGGGLTF